MPKNALACTFVTLLVAAPVGAVPDLRVALEEGVTEEATQAAEPISFDGRYIWNQGDKGDIEVTFEATGNNTWDVSFHFTFRKQDHTYRGTAEGSLFNGELNGEVRSDRGAAYLFAGSFDNGVFSGEHFRYNPKSGNKSLSGTLTFEPA